MHGECGNLQLYELIHGNEEKWHAALCARGSWIDKVYKADDSLAREETLRQYGSLEGKVSFYLESSEGSGWPRLSEQGKNG